MENYCIPQQNGVSICDFDLDCSPIGVCLFADPDVVFMSECTHRVCTDAVSYCLSGRADIERIRTCLIQVKQQLESLKRTISTQ